MRPRSPAPIASPVARATAVAMVVGGALLTLGAVFADPLGLTWGGEGYGWKQLIATIAGLVLLLLGGAWLVQGQHADRPRPGDTFTTQE